MTRDELIRRVNGVSAGARRQWGKMSAPQMFEHLARNLEMGTGQRRTRQLFVGWLISLRLSPSRAMMATK